MNPTHRISVLAWRELDNLLRNLPLEDNNAVFNLCCSLCTAYEHKTFLDGLQYGAHLMLLSFTPLAAAEERKRSKYSETGDF